MFTLHSSMRTLAWAAIAISTAYADDMADSLSFGHRVGSIVPEQQSVAGWSILGEQYIPELLSDRVILTPPYPGNKRGALWAQDRVQRTEWKSELYFRATGPERASANLQLWYVKDGLHSVGAASLYTVDRFDGLAISIDQYGGRGGMIRGFLNDGSTPYLGSSSIDTYSFGQCQYSYRNQGRFSVLTLQQTATEFEVRIDQMPCFKSEKILLPPGYDFGITAASAETPDSFEIHKFETSYPPSTHDQTTGDTHHLQEKFHQQQQTPLDTGAAPPSQAVVDDSKAIPDVLAETIKDQQQQFADLHNRIQFVNHRIDHLMREIQDLAKKQEERHIELMNRAIPAHDNSVNLLQTGNRIERTVNSILKDVEGKDYSERLSQLQSIISQSHAGIMEGIPKHMTNIVSTATPKMTTLILIIAVIQVVVFGGYLLYKKRRAHMPKKYL